jgi:hypothetical protein
VTRVEVRATVNLPELQVGTLALVDPEMPFIRTCLDAGLLVPTGRTVSTPDVPARGASRPLTAALDGLAASDDPVRAKRKRAGSATADTE